MNETKRAYCENYEYMYPQQEYLNRNHNIVDASEILIACPAQTEEVIRSGTWATIRYARKNNKIIRFIGPEADNLS